MTTKEIKQIHDINPIGMMRAKQVLELVPFGRASLWKFAKSGQFPQPIRVTGGITAWRNQDVIDWLEAQSAANDAEV
ncbi:helix-turn-helix transcriptional regulator [Psychrobacter fozii]|uniref:helix-turn-helix transcriptional regulator n=1 Tax=Psychrobacter fozii TaxID=198480 RepID=UPI00191815E1|nr:AlpA family phage regulatory protein [Psychrobacter fozii]